MWLDADQFFIDFYHTDSSKHQSKSFSAAASQLPAVFNSIDRFLQGTAPIFCLPFDDIGARRPPRHLIARHDAA